MKEHLHGVRLRKDRPIMAHFADNHNERDLQFSILEKLYKANHTEQLLQEAVRIKRLKTGRPQRCNVKDINLPLQLRCQ